MFKIVIVWLSLITGDPATTSTHQLTFSTMEACKAALQTEQLIQDTKEAAAYYGVKYKLAVDSVDCYPIGEEVM